MAALREVLAHFGVEVDTHALAHGHHKVNKFVGALKNAAITIGGGLLAHHTAHFVEQQIEAAESLGVMAARMGVNIEQLQLWQRAGILVNATAEDVNSAFTDLSRNAGLAASGYKKQAQAFKRFGIDIKDEHGNLRATEDLFLESAIAIARLPNPLKQAAAATKIFGGSGQALLPLFQKGEEGIEELRREVKELGPTLTRDAAEKAAVAADELKKMKIQVDSLLNEALMKILPVVVEWAEKIEHVVNSITKFLSQDKQLEHIFLILKLGAIAVGAALVFMNLPVIAAIALVGAAILIFEDLVTALEGGESAIQDFFQAWLGIDIVPILERIVNGVHQVIIAGQFLINQHQTLVDLWSNSKAVFLGWAFAALQALTPVVRLIDRIVVAVSKLTGIKALAGLSPAGGFSRLLDNVAGAANNAGLGRVRERLGRSNARDQELFTNSHANAGMVDDWQRQRAELLGQQLAFDSTVNAFREGRASLRSTGPSELVSRDMNLPRGAAANNLQQTNNIAPNITINAGDQDPNTIAERISSTLNRHIQDAGAAFMSEVRQ